MTKSYSWGNYPNVKTQKTHPLWWSSDAWPTSDMTLLPYGKGLSYGDSCLNQRGILLSTHHLNRFIDFNRETGILHCECGVTIGDILQLISPTGWFLSAIPGTQHVTVGGAIANDVHGKDHWLKGCFGSHITELTLLRSDGETLICSPTQHKNMFFATIGGLGLTGLIVSAKIQCHQHPAMLRLTNTVFHSMNACFDLFEDKSTSSDHLVAWVNASTNTNNFFKGILSQTAFTNIENPTIKTKRIKLTIPFFLPSFILNQHTVSLFNKFYWHKHKNINRIIHYDKFFFPLDSICNWNKIYGKCGFLQYQFVAPPDACIHILQAIKRSKLSVFLITVKKMGNIKSPGLLSFPKEGYSIALDLPFQGSKMLTLLNHLDEIILSHQGRIYPAKDARMSAKTFQLSYPNWQDFAKYIDVKFSSDFWDRVTEGER